jgi:SynChlorMet cassette protein ScmC
MKYQIPTPTALAAGLALADGSIWEIIAGDDRASDVVSVLAKAMQLQFLDKRFQIHPEYPTYRRLFVHVEDRKKDSDSFPTTVHLTFEDQKIICTLISDESHEMGAFQLMLLSMVICRDVQYRGGILLHGALAEWNGNGVILAGPGGRGKTTASRRLPRHWQSFCDDTTLVVCDNKGGYWAHPWPTWSTFMFNGPVGTWNVQYAVSLKGIFFLEQAHDDKIKPLGSAQNVCRLNASAEEVSWPMPRNEDKNVLRELRLQRFNNICNLAKAISSYILRISPDGCFWKEIERTLNG